MRRILAGLGLVLGLAIMVYALGQGPLWLFTCGLVLAVAAFRLLLVRLVCPACKHVHLDGSGSVSHCAMCGTTLDDGSVDPEPRRLAGALGGWGFGLALIASSWALDHGRPILGLIVLVAGVGLLLAGFRRVICPECGTKVLTPAPLAHCQTCGASLDHETATPDP